MGENGENHVFFGRHTNFDLYTQSITNTLKTPNESVIIGNTMAKIIVLFNHKGGVSKTTTTLNLGWKLSQMGKNVLLVDFDPQCNLTGMLSGITNTDGLTKLYEKHNSNIKEGLAPAFESRPNPITPVQCVQLQLGPGELHLLPGHMDLSDYESTLNLAQELSGHIHPLHNLPGSIVTVLQETAKSIGADYVLIDTSPNLGSINRNLLMICDYFLVPATPDFYSMMAIDSLSKILPKWYDWAKKTSELNVFKNSVYPFPEPHPKFLGTIIQRYRPKYGLPTHDFQNWIDKIETRVAEILIPTFQNSNLMLNSSRYSAAGIEKNFTLSYIPDFNRLIAISQEVQKPIFNLSPKDLGAKTSTQIFRENSVIENFDNIFSNLARTIIKLTTND